MDYRASQLEGTTQPEASDLSFDLETSVDQVIALCAGDLRTAIRSLLVANQFLEAENVRLQETVSVGHVLGRMLGATPMARLWRGC